MSQTCERCYRITHRACQSDTESSACPLLAHTNRGRIVIPASDRMATFKAKDRARKRRLTTGSLA